MTLNNTYKNCFQCSFQTLFRSVLPEFTEVVLYLNFYRLRRLKNCPFPPVLKIVLLSLCELNLVSHRYPSQIIELTLTKRSDGIPEQILINRQAAGKRHLGSIQGGKQLRQKWATSDLVWIGFLSPYEVKYSLILNRENKVSLDLLLLHLSLSRCLYAD